MNNIWMITYSTWDNSRFGNHQTSTIITELHPIKWRDKFLKDRDKLKIAGCNILFAIEGPSE